MQSVAAEMNLSETAFLVAADDSSWHLRWFTPAVEVDLCGHATLASAHVLWETSRLAMAEDAVFQTRVSGELRARRASEETIEMDFPSMEGSPCPEPTGLAKAIGCSLRFVSRNRDDYLVELDSADAVRALSPDIGALRGLGVRGVICTSVSDNAEYDFISRFFAPGAGVDEDPVTGSAHCFLAPHWASRLGKNDLTGYQASQRGGVVDATVCGDRVTLRGRAITVLSGLLVCDDSQIE